MDPSAWTYLVSNVGFPIAMAIFLLWWIKHIQQEAVKRERRLGERIDKLEDEHRSELVELIKTNVQAQDQVSQALKDSNDVLKRLCRNIDSLVSHLEKRPCLGVDEPGPVGDILGGSLPRSQDPTGQTTERRTLEREQVYGRSGRR